jgi:SMC interacting uncharacterized protein involved in chromosome segregation
LENDKGSINISNNTGEVTGVTLGSTGTITGKYVVVGSGTINASEQQLAKIPNEYAESLRAFSEKINNQLQGSQVPEEQVESLKQSINKLAKELEDIKPGKEQEIDEEKRVDVEAKTTGVIQRVLNVLPQVAENAATFTPLAPISKLIGKGVQEIINAIQRRKSGSS